MLSIVGGLYDKLVADVSDAVICKLKAEGAAHFTLESELLSAAIVDAMRVSIEVRDSIRDIVDDKIDNIDLCQISEFSDLQRDVESMQEKIDNIEAAVVDADDSDFADAVRSVIRNNI